MTQQHIPAHIVHELITSSDIVELIESKIHLIKRGQNYVANCPFHQEKTPSFTVNAHKQFYYCFGCGANGNVIGFLMAYDHIGFVEAIEFLATQRGITLQYSSQPNNTLKQSHHYVALEQVATYYRQALEQSTTALQYLKTRKLNPEICKHFYIGYAPPGWDNLHKHLPISTSLQSLLIEHGLCVTKPSTGCYDRFRNRLIFPIHNTQGRIIAFGGRTLDSQATPKYLNSPETVIFHKHRELYGLYQARQTNPTLQHILVVEGYLDVITLHQHQFTQAVATMGTAVNVKHIQKLLRYTNMIIFCFDGDDAGRKAAWKALTVSLPLLQDDIEFRFLLLPDGSDPDSLLNNHGATHFQQQLQNALPLATYFFQTLQQTANLNTLAGKAQLAKQACAYLDTIPTGIYQHLLYQQLAKLLHIDIEQLKQKKSTLSFSIPPFAGTNKNDPSSSSPIAKMDGSSNLSLPYPIYHAICLLLHQPTLARITQIAALEEYPNEKKSLFITLLNLYQQKPWHNIGELLACLHSPSEQQFVAQLAARELFIPNSGILEEYKGTLERILQYDIEQQIQQFIEKAKNAELNAVEKQQLQSLFTSKHKKTKSVLLNTQQFQLLTKDDKI